MSLNYNYALPNSNLTQLTSAMTDSINQNMNCCKIAKVIEFNKNDFTVKCRILNKKLTGLNKDGSQKLSDYPIIYAKVHNIGYGSIGITHPIVEGQEGLLLFNDRELETWFLTGDSGLLKYDRTHDLTDALFICGFHSKNNVSLIKYIEECLNIYYNNSSIQLTDDSININTSTINEVAENINTTANVALTGNMTVTGNQTISGTLEAHGFSDLTAYSGTFLAKDDRTVTVENGIIKSVN